MTVLADLDWIRKEIEAGIGPIDLLAATPAANFTAPGPIEDTPLELEETPLEGWRAN